MSSNNDSMMTRFLFAILKQKNLKDINWDAVAKDEILPQPISNGHAARMRYSRFKTAMLGNEPTRRNRTGQGKGRVTKSKKDPKGKKDELVKLESALESLPESSVTPEPSDMPAPEIKQESTPYSFDDRFTPRLTPGPSVPIPATAVSSNHGVIQPRFLTPGSDSDFFSPPPTFTSSPASELVTSQNSFSFRDSPCPDHSDPMWPSVPHYSAFGAGSSFDEFRASPCEPPHVHSHPHMLPFRTVECDDDYVHVKHEWDEYS